MLVVPDDARPLQHLRDVLQRGPADGLGNDFVAGPHDLQVWVELVKSWVEPNEFISKALNRTKLDSDRSRLMIS